MLISLSSYPLIYVYCLLVLKLYLLRANLVIYRCLAYICIYLWIFMVFAIFAPIICLVHLLLLYLLIGLLLIYTKRVRRDWVLTLNLLVSILTNNIFVLVMHRSIIFLKIWILIIGLRIIIRNLNLINRSLLIHLSVYLLTCGCFGVVFDGLHFKIVF